MRTNFDSANLPSISKLKAISDQKYNNVDINCPTVHMSQDNKRKMSRLCNDSFLTNKGLGAKCLRLEPASSAKRMLQLSLKFPMILHSVMQRPVYCISLTPHHQ